MKPTFPTIAISCTLKSEPSKVASPELSDESFITYIENTVLKTIREYSLFTKEDRVLVAASGGKDSTALAYILKKFGYNIEAVTVNAHIGCYTDENLRNLRSVCNKWGIPLHEISFRKEFGGSLCYIRDAINEQGHNLKSCSVCGVFRRYLINKKARELNPTCIALGHNLDDEAQALLLNVIKNTLYLSARMGPTTGVRRQKMVPRVKPLYFVSESEIIRYVRIMNFPVHVGKCPCSIGGQRNFIKDMLNDLEQQVPLVKQNMVSFFLSVREKLSSQKGEFSLNECDSCGEPASQTTCRTCQLLSYVQSKQLNEELSAKTTKVPAHA